MMVVDVLITNCQVSENLNIGPQAAQPMTSAQHATNTRGRPVHRAVVLANFVNPSPNLLNS